jgi:hypothetical protein
MPEPVELSSYDPIGLALEVRRLLIVLGVQMGTLSEGEACQVLNLERVAFREVRQFYRERCEQLYTQWGERQRP